MAKDSGLISSGCPGLDDVLGGGLQAGELYLLEGDPGAGKTTLSLQFLMEGVRQGQRTLYVTLSESKMELQRTAKSHGFSLEGIEIMELMPGEEELKPESQYRVFHSADVELTDRMQTMMQKFQEVNPPTGGGRALRIAHVVQRTPSVSSADSLDERCARPTSLHRPSVG
jgi:circadian clock protein KaiC